MSAERGVATHEDLGSRHEPGGSSDRAFGVVFAVVFALVGLWPLLSGGAVRPWSLAVAAAFLALALAVPRVLAAPNRWWTRFGLLLGRIVSPVVLGVVFFAVVTPMAIAIRWRGRDPLRLKRSAADASYWIPREPPGPKPDSLNRQF